VGGRGEERTSFRNFTTKIRAVKNDKNTLRNELAGKTERRIVERGRNTRLQMGISVNSPRRGLRSKKKLMKKSSLSTGKTV